MIERRIVVMTRNGKVEHCYLLEQDFVSDASTKADLDAIAAAARSRGFDAEFRTPWHPRPMTAPMIAERVGKDIDLMGDAEEEDSERDAMEDALRRADVAAERAALQKLGGRL